MGPAAGLFGWQSAGGASYNEALMSESLPLPQALRFLVEDDSEWLRFQPYLEPGQFPLGIDSWLNENDLEAAWAEEFVRELGGRLAVALSEGRLSASGFLAGATYETQIDGTRCKHLEICGEDGTDIRIRGLDYAWVLITKRPPKDSPGKLAEKRKLEGELTRGLEPFIARLKEQHGQTTYKELRTLLEAKGLPPFAESLLKKSAAAAGLTRGMVRRGRPRETNPERE